MSYKNQNWYPFKKKAKIIELNVKDNDNQTIDFFKLYDNKTRDTKRIFQMIREKYDFSLLERDQKNNEKSSEENDKIDWLK